MNDKARLQTGGQQVVEALRRHGTDTVFCVPGESFLDVLNALHAVQDHMRLVNCRHEGGAAFMAEAHGKLTGRPGVCMVTRGPGASNAAIGLHTAFQDATPMILLIGQVSREHLERGAFQEIDYRRMFGPLCKWVAQIDDVSRIDEFIDRAFSVAISGQPGPVVLALPEDMLTDSSFPLAPSDHARAPRPMPHAAPVEMQHLRDMLAVARRPLLWLGGSGWSDAGLRDMTAFAAAQLLPVVCSFRRQDLFDNDDPHYVGETGLGMRASLGQAIEEADLLLVVGARLSDVATKGYTLLRCPYPNQVLVHVLQGAEELGRNYQPALAIQAAPDAFASAAAQLPCRASAQPDDGSRDARHGWLASLRNDYLAFSEPTARAAKLDPAVIIRTLRDRLDADAIVTNGAGNYSAWAHRYYRFRRPRTQLAPTSGAMGYGLPAAIAAKLAFPQRQVVCLAGDGCFLMTGQELATARRFGLAIVCVVFNNGMYGTIRMHQEMQYPGHTIGTDLFNPDFVAYAKAFGLDAVRIDDHNTFGAALDTALTAPHGGLIELVVDPEVITPSAALSTLRRQAAEATQ